MTVSVKLQIFRLQLVVLRRFRNRSIKLRRDRVDSQNEVGPIVFYWRFHDCLDHFDPTH